MTIADTNGMGGIEVRVDAADGYAGEVPWVEPTPTGPSAKDIRVGNRRLLKLAAFLEKLPRKKFDFGHWSYGWDGSPKSCGTAACAMGWATTIPEFRRLGLHLEAGWGVAYPVLGGLDGISAARDLFRLSGLDDAVFLFLPRDPDAGHDDRRLLPANATPKQVAKRIRKFVAAREPSKGVKGRRGAA